MEKSLDGLVNDWVLKTLHAKFLASRPDTVDKEVLPFIRDVRSLAADTLRELGPAAKSKWRSLLTPQGGVPELTADAKAHLRAALGSLEDEVDKFSIEAAGITLPDVEAARTETGLLKAELEELLSNIMGASRDVLATMDRGEYMMDQVTSNQIEIGAEFIKVERRKAKTKKGKKQAVPLPAPVLAQPMAPDFEVEASKSESGDRQPRDVTAGEGVFPQRPLAGGWYRTAERKQPLIGGRVVRNLEGVDMTKVEWRVTEHAVYYKIDSQPLELLKIAQSSGFIPTECLAEVIATGRFADDDTPIAPGVSAARVADRISPHFIDAADLWFWWAQIETICRVHKMEAKLPFVNKWCRRMFDVPPELEHAAVTCLERFCAALRRAVKRKDSFNGVFKMFLSGNMANWKIGEDRATFIERTQKSREYFWGAYAKTYEKLWLQTPDAQFSIRPKADSWTRKVKAYVNKKREELAVAASIAVDAGSDRAKFAATRVAELMDDLAAAESHLTRRERFRLWTGKVQRAIPKWVGLGYHARPAGATLPLPDGTEERVIPASTMDIIIDYFKLTIGRPFVRPYEFNRFEVNGEVRPVTMFKKRDWFKDVQAEVDSWQNPRGSMTDGWTWFIPVPIKAPISVVAESAKGLFAGAKKALFHAGAWFSAANALEPEEVVNTPTPDLGWSPKKLWANLAATVIIGAGAVAVGAATAVPLAGAGLFITLSCGIDLLTRAFRMDELNPWQVAADLEKSKSTPPPSATAEEGDITIQDNRS